MNTKTLLSLVLSSTLGLAVIGNLFAGNLLVSSILVFAGLGVGVLSHLAFFEEKKKKPKGAGPVPWLNLGMSYGLLLLSLGVFLFLLISPSESRQSTIAKAGQVAGNETEGSTVPQSNQTDVASGGERARLGSSGRGEGLDALGGQMRIIKMPCVRPKYLIPQSREQMAVSPLKQKFPLKMWRK